MRGRLGKRDKMMRIDSTAGWTLGSLDKNTRNAFTTDPARAQNTTSTPTKQATRPPAHVQADVRNTEDQPEEPKTTFERIAEVGFSTFVTELEAEKREKLREKILREMGLSAEDLAKMSPEQRDAIEKLVAEEMKRRMAAASLMNNNEADNQTGENAPQTGANGLTLPFGKLALGPMGGNGSDPISGGNGFVGMGLGPLLALQEVQDSAHAQSARTDGAKPGQNDRDDG